MMKSRELILFFILILSVNGCKNSDSHSDTPTYGEITISADETFKPLIDSEIATFKGIYKYADVKVNYKPQEEAFNDLMNDTTRLIIVSRNLTKDELKEFRRWEIVPKVTKIAISLPEEVLTAVEKEREGSGESRSQIFRRAAELLLRQRQEREASEQYIRSYQQFPETEEEVAAALRAARTILAEEPWS